MTSKKSGRIGILGGTFDPVHNGHVKLGQAAVLEAKLEKLIVMPAKIQPFKLHRKITADCHRLAMAKLAFEGVCEAEISDYEIKYTQISYSYDTLMYLQNIYRDKRLYFILGTDSFLQIEKWYEGAEILRNFSLIVSVRPGYAEKELEACIEYYSRVYAAEVIQIASEMPNVSSTSIREVAAEGMDLSDMIPKSVERYIKDNGLYLRN